MSQDLPTLSRARLAGLRVVVKDFWVMLLLSLGSAAILLVFADPPALPGYEKSEFMLTSLALYTLCFLGVYLSGYLLYGLFSLACDRLKVRKKI